MEPICLFPQCKSDIYFCCFRADGMYSRRPIPEEKEAYDLEHDIAIFLPHYEAGQQEVDT